MLLLLVVVGVVLFVVVVMDVNVVVVVFAAAAAVVVLVDMLFMDIKTWYIYAPEFQKPTCVFNASVSFREELSLSR